MGTKPIKMGMMPPPVGEFIREDVLEPLGLSISKAAEIMNVRRPTLSDIINGKARLSPDIALRMEMAFGVSMGLLLRMQATYEVAEARQSAGTLNIKRYVPA